MSVINDIISKSHKGLVLANQVRSWHIFCELD